MRARGADAWLRGLEAHLAETVSAGEPVRLAFSGGVASLLLAALVRKRAELECVVAGVGGAEDLWTAVEERLYLDYSVTEVRLTPDRALAMARGLARRFPSWSVAEILDMIPLEAVRARFPTGPILAGFGGQPILPRLADALSADRFACPLLAAGNTSLRPRLVDAARALDLPAAFVGAPHRRPANGSGVGPALRALSRTKQRPVARLLRP